MSEQHGRYRNEPEISALTVRLLEVAEGARRVDRRQVGVTLVGVTSWWLADLTRWPGGQAAVDEILDSLDAAGGLRGSVEAQIAAAAGAGDDAGE